MATFSKGFINNYSCYRHVLTSILVRVLPVAHVKTEAASPAGLRNASIQGNAATALKLVVAETVPVHLFVLGICCHWGLKYTSDVPLAIVVLIHTLCKKTAVLKAPAA